MYFPPMFRGLFNFGKQRFGLEVVAFYISYLIGTIIAGAIVGSIIASLFGGDAVRIQWKADIITASIFILIITFQIIKYKGLREKNMLFNFLPLVTAVITQFFSPAIGMIIPTVLSTLPGTSTFTPPPSSSNVGANMNQPQTPPTNDYQNNPPQKN